MPSLAELLEQRSIAALIVPMHESMHASFRWLARGAKVTKGYAIQIGSREPILVTYPMERDEAAKTGLEVHLVQEFGFERIFGAASTPAEAYGAFFDAMLSALDVRSPIAFSGNGPLHLYQGIFEELGSRGREVHRSGGEDLIQLARKKKEPWEIEKIRSVGERTEQVVDAVRRELRDGRAKKLGDLKALVTHEIARLGMIEDHETILSQGRDAGIPHSRGDANAPFRPSVPLVLDIFPVDRESGYFFDLTRTFCVGAASKRLRRLHRHVLEAFLRARDAMRPGTLASSYQALVCDLFEGQGYRTTRSRPGTLNGYVHSLGHGVGLDIHERPFFGLSPSNRDLIEVGDVVTIEPGLYFPDEELGVRIEDTFVVNDDGVETLCRGSYELEP